MLKIDIYILLLPFLSVICSAIAFYLLQIFFKKKYFLNLIFSLFFAFFLIIVFIYKTSLYLSELQIFYLVFSTSCISFIFMNIIQACVSSLQLAILRIIYFYPGIKRKEVVKKYNANHVFEERIKRLESGGLIYKKRSLFFIKNKKILLVLNLFLSLKKIFNVKY
jgi:hypothetical protein